MLTTCLKFYETFLRLKKKFENFEILWNFLKFWNFMKIFNFVEIFEILKFFENFEIFWKFWNFMKFLQFDWPTGNEISSLVGRWASPNIPHASCTHCTQGVLTLR
jgi:hypothetical protein